MDNWLKDPFFLKKIANTLNNNLNNCPNNINNLIPLSIQPVGSILISISNKTLFHTPNFFRKTRIKFNKDKIRKKIVFIIVIPI